VRGPHEGLTLYVFSGRNKSKGRMCVIRRDVFGIGGSYTLHSLISIYMSIPVSLYVPEERYRGTYRGTLQAGMGLGHSRHPPIWNTSPHTEHIRPLVFPGAHEEYRMRGYAYPCRYRDTSRAHPPGPHGACCRGLIVGYPLGVWGYILGICNFMHAYGDACIYVGVSGALQRAHVRRETPRFEAPAESVSVNGA
jgi:hypothetical protein